MAGEEIWKYNIHEFIQITSNVDLKNKFFEVESVNPNLIINVKDGINYDISKCNKVGWDFYGIPDADFLYYRGVRSEVFIKDLKGCTELTVNNAFFNRNRGLSWDSLLSAVLFLKLLQKNCSFIHSACFSVKNSSFLLLAFPDTGKTSTIISIIEQQDNAEYLSDDLTIIDKKGNTYCYPIPITLSSKVIQRILNNKKVGLKQLLKLKFYSFLQRHLSTNYISSRLFKFPPKEYIWDIIKNIKIAKKAKVNAICLLEYGEDGVEKVNSGHMLKKVNLTNTEIVQHLTTNPIITIYSYFNSKMDLFHYLKLYQEITESFLNKAESFIIRSKKGTWHKTIKEQILPCYI